MESRYTENQISRSAGKGHLKRTRSICEEGKKTVKIAVFSFYTCRYERKVIRRASLSELSKGCICVSKYSMIFLRLIEGE